MTVLVDTNVLVAAALRRDASHSRAVSILSGLADTRAFTTDLVLMEGWMVLRRHDGWHQAMRFWRGLRGTALAIESVLSEDLARAEAIADTWADQEFDLVDCTSFAVMERLGCRCAATFDKDFAVYRHGPDRRHAFEILA